MEDWKGEKFNLLTLFLMLKGVRDSILGQGIRMVRTTLLQCLLD